MLWLSKGNRTREAGSRELVNRPKVRGSLGIVVPFFSNEEYLKCLLNSLVAQSSTEWVAVVVDDSGSQNRAREIVESFDSNRMSFTKNETNLGIGRCWNIGLQHLVSNTDVSVFAVIHADDELEQNYVERVLTAHKVHPDAAAIHTSVSLIGEKGRSKFSFPDLVKRVTRPGGSKSVVVTSGDNGLASVLKGNFIFCPTLSFKRDHVTLPLFNDEWKMVIDLELVSRLLLSGEVIVGLSERIYRYRRHRNNLTASYNKTTIRFREEIELYRELEAKCVSCGFDVSSRIAKRMTIIRLHILYQLLGSALHLDLSLFRRLIKVFVETF